MKKIIICALSIILSTIFSIGGLSPVFAANRMDCDDTTIPESVRQSAGCIVGNNKQGLRDSIVIILNSIIGVTGFIAVIFVVIGGINYMTSAGDASKVEKAKKTIIYALIGMIICALAFAIVNFTIGIIPKS